MLRYNEQALTVHWDVFVLLHGGAVLNLDYMNYVIVFGDVAAFSFS